jgi:cation:H+ antiporter
VALGGVALIVWGAETFAEHLAVASTRLGVSTFALALLLTGALARPLQITDATALRGPWLAMLAGLDLVLLLALPARRLDRRAGVVLLAAYPAFIAFVLAGG